MAAPDHHGNGEAEQRRQGCPTNGDQHAALKLLARILPRLAAVRGVGVTTSNSPTAVLERQQQRQAYPNFKVVVLNDEVNTFQHVVD